VAGERTAFEVRERRHKPCMKNPWLEIPLQEYEAHMALPNVGQAPLLAGLLAGTVYRYEPRSVAILGCSGGNGLERILDTQVQRIVGIDINPDYAERTRQARMCSPPLYGSSKCRSYSGHLLVGILPKTNLTPALRCIPMSRLKSSHLRCCATNCETSLIRRLWDRD
jgi:hypothetical protein